MARLSSQFRGEGKRITLIVREDVMKWIRSLGKRKGMPYSWVLDEILMAIRMGDQDRLDRILE